MTKSELVELIESLYYRHDLEGTAIHATCLDVLGGENKKGAEFKAINNRVNEAFNCIRPELQEVFNQQDIRDTTTKQALQAGKNNIISGYFS